MPSVTLPFWSLPSPLHSSGFPCSVSYPFLFPGLLPCLGRRHPSSFSKKKSTYKRKCFKAWNIWKGLYPTLPPPHIKFWGGSDSRAAIEQSEDCHIPHPLPGSHPSLETCKISLFPALSNITAMSLGRVFSTVALGTLWVRQYASNVTSFNSGKYSWIIWWMISLLLFCVFPFWNSFYLWKLVSWSSNLFIFFFHTFDFLCFCFVCLFLFYFPNDLLNLSSNSSNECIFSESFSFHGFFSLCWRHLLQVSFPCFGLHLSCWRPSPGVCQCVRTEDGKLVGWACWCKCYCGESWLSHVLRTHFVSFFSSFILKQVRFSREDLSNTLCGGRINGPPKLPL